MSLSLCLILVSLGAAMSADAASDAICAPTQDMQFLARRSADSDSRGAANAFAHRDYDLAIHFATQVVEGSRASHHDAAAWTTMCASYGALGQWQAAWQACEAAVSINPDSWQAWNNRAILAAQREDWSGARRDFQIAARLNGDDRVLKANLASLACKAGA